MARRSRTSSTTTIRTRARPPPSAPKARRPPPDVHAVSSVPRRFPEATVVCLGGGPSLTPEDVGACRGRAVVIAISDAYRLAPWADVLYSCDAKWWEYHRDAVEFPGLKFSLDRRAAHRPGVQVLQNTGSHGLETEPTGLRTGQ